MSRSESLGPSARKRAAQGAVVAIGRATSAVRLLPQFLVAGAQRSGTTSMYRALAQHPEVLKPLAHKGVHYFDTDYDRGWAWYRAHFPTRLHAAVVRRRTGVTPLTFESSPYYLCHPLAPERIARDLAGIRLVVLLRNPVERAYSAHSHELARGFETENFERALELESERLRGEEQRIVAEPSYNSHSHQHHAYLGRGQYVTYLRHLERHFGRDRLHVVDSHDFFADPRPAYDGVTRFLGLTVAENVHFDQHNARQRSPMPERVRTRLDDFFAPWDEELTEWLGYPPSWRR